MLQLGGERLRSQLRVASSEPSVPPGGRSEEDDEVDDVLVVGDRQGVVRWHEEVVDQREAEGRRHQCRADPGGHAEDGMIDR